jgi:hypothetical protein
MTNFKDQKKLDLSHRGLRGELGMAWILAKVLLIDCAIHRLRYQ